MENQFLVLKENYEQVIQDTVVTTIKKHGKLLSLKKNSYIFNEEDEATAIYYVQEGLVKVSQITELGDNVTFVFRGPCEMFGGSELLLGKKRIRYAKCLNNSEVYALYSSDYFKLLAEDTEFLHGNLLMFASSLLQTQINITSLITKRAEWRLALLLSQLGEQSKEEKKYITLVLSHEEISNLVGCSRQTVTEILNKWKAEGSISYSRNEIVIHNLEKLLSEV